MNNKLWFTVHDKQIWLGGTPNQTTLAKCFMNKVKIQDLEKVLEPLFYNWKVKRLESEPFGVFTSKTVSAISMSYLLKSSIPTSYLLSMVLEMWYYD